MREEQECKEESYCSTQVYVCVHIEGLSVWGLCMRVCVFKHACFTDGTHLYRLLFILSNK